MGKQKCRYRINLRWEKIISFANRHWRGCLWSYWEKICLIPKFKWRFLVDSSFDYSLELLKQRRNWCSCQPHHWLNWTHHVLTSVSGTDAYRISLIEESEKSYLMPQLPHAWRGDYPCGFSLFSSQIFSVEKPNIFPARPLQVVASELGYCIRNMYVYTYNISVSQRCVAKDVTMWLQSIRQKAQTYIQQLMGGTLYLVKAVPDLRTERGI